MPRTSRSSSLERVLPQLREQIRLRIRRKIGRHVRRLADSEDAVDSGFAQAIERGEESRASLDRLSAFAGYATKAALNRVRDLGRRLRVERRQPVDRNGNSAPRLETLSTSDPSPSSHVRRAEERDLLDQLLRELQPRDEAAIRNHHLLGLRGQELGDSLGVSASAAAHRVQRAWCRLRSLAARREQDAIRIRRSSG